MRLRLGEQAYDLTRRALMMGVVNRSRFSDAYRHSPLDALLWRAEQLVGDGADVLAIGARANGVGAGGVSVAEETDLVCEAVIALLARFDVSLSVDSEHSRVAAAAFAAGAVLGNDPSGFGDPAYLPAAARAGAAVVASNTSLSTREPDPGPEGDVVDSVASRLRRLVDTATRAGVHPESVLVAPGLDLWLTSQQSVTLLEGVPQFVATGCPVLVAMSDEADFGRPFGAETAQRRDTSLVACALAAALGARVFRVADVRRARRVVDLACATTTGPGSAWWQRNNWSG